MKKHSKRTSPYVPAPRKFSLMPSLLIVQRKSHGHAKSECGEGLDKCINPGRYGKLGSLIYKNTRIIKSQRPPIYIKTDLVQNVFNIYPNIHSFWYSAFLPIDLRLCMVTLFLHLPLIFLKVQVKEKLFILVWFFVCLKLASFCLNI